MVSITKRCSVNACENSGRLIRGWCTRHYDSWRNHGDPMGAKFRPERHGMYRTPEYESWRHLKQRCYNTKHKHYSYYGGRGIQVCERWRTSFTAFYNDMGKKPTPEHTVDRINPDGHYEPSNCRWATRREQRLNQRPRRKAQL